VLAKNPRAGYRPLPISPPGDPTLLDLARSDMTWTIQADEAALLTAVAVEAEDLSWAMVLREADKQGNLSVPRCQALGISNGRCTALASCLHVAERPCPVGFTCASWTTPLFGVQLLKQWLRASLQ
jgi:hypothetical protein